MITHLDQMIAFRNFVIEKAALQTHLYPNVVRAIRVSSALITNLETYDKQDFMQGFFETYLRPLSEMTKDA